MSKKVLLRPASSHRRQPLLQQSHGGSGKAGTRMGEVVGGTAAVCCCCPCGLANIMYLAIYKVPASLCLKALKNKRRRKIQNKREGLFPPRRRCTCGCSDHIGVQVVQSSCKNGDDDVACVKSEKEDKEVMELEKEMRDRFNSTGFWRSSSQRESSTCSTVSSVSTL
ncbi:uncharacterized protein LOC133317341 [Gastrolobium bilobum]|uniref:uncharacterized protein LOC133317341 n=1 Tax=Gastrolobium bilobum TaxID=150636 RepID=UPI002AB191EA|nr:uncharacterized protein LOC133317341 [Gastrolobium bilobum]